MGNESEKHARSITNSSGFPLQIKIADIANSLREWNVLLEEHPWRSDKSEGFLDIVLEKQTGRDAMVIECKRVNHIKWVFLVPKPKPIKFSLSRILESRYVKSKWDRFGWNNWQADPVSFESQFCAIPGQEHGHRNSLERTASKLVEAIEEFAWQEKELHEQRVKTQDYFKDNFARNYIPVIVTTAELVVSCFEPRDISLKDGFLPSNADFETVPFVRFRKSLTSKLSSSHKNSIKEAHVATERTVFIVNAEGFEEFLLSFNFQEIYV